MSQVRRPLPPSVYWRRRIVVLGGLLVVIAVIVLIIVRPGAGDVGSNEAPADVEAVEEVKPPACLPTQLELVARTDKQNYEPSEVPQMWLMVKNISTTECTLAVGTDVQRYVITSGEDQIWASDDCQKIRTPFEITALPGVENETEPLPWDRTRSSPDTCDSPSRPLMPGGGASYDLRVYLGELSSESARRFLLN